MMKGNRGEWSELYTLLRLMADGKLYAADEDTNKIDDIYYDVIKAIRKETNGRWEYIRDGKVRVIYAETGEEILSIPIEDFENQADILLKRIKEVPVGERVFEIPEVYGFAQSIKCNTLKAKSTDKSDITLMVHDLNTGTNPILGFSIKSQLGSPSTLLNASNATNFTYKVEGYEFNNNEIKEINNTKRFKEKFEYIYSHGARLEFLYMDSTKFEFNLKMIDTSLPKAVSSLLFNFYSGKASSVSDLAQLVIEENPLGVDSEDAEVFYSYKIKELLTNIALGMVPGAKWNGRYEATGGYIIVKGNGDVLCYHIYNRNEFRDYLYKNTKLETPSTSRYGLGRINNTDRGQEFKLNLQVRFVK